VVKLTAKEVGRLINRSPKYVYQLLLRKGISLKTVHFDELIDLICEYKWQRYKLGKKGVKRFFKRGMMTRTALKRFDAMFAELYELVKSRADGKCVSCGGEGGFIHHIDLDHGNMRFENLMFVCGKCHKDIHGYALFWTHHSFKKGAYAKRESNGFMVNQLREDRRINKEGVEGVYGEV